MSHDLSPLGQYLRSSTYILALLGAGLSSPLGVPTFTDHGASWRTYESKYMATRSAFAQDPVIVWQFYEDRRRNALAAQPNLGHVALAQLAKTKSHFLAITQNIDGLSQRAGHDATKLAAIHGSLFNTTCFDQACTFTELSCNVLPKVPALGLPNCDVSHPAVPLPVVTVEELPHCPKCKSSLQRPGVVWFGEQLPLDMLARIDEWFESVPQVDLLLVVGTSARVFPAAEYIDRARERGAYVAHFNLYRDDELMCPGDWFVPGDAARTLPGIVGEALDVTF